MQGSGDHGKAVFADHDTFDFGKVAFLLCRQFFEQPIGDTHSQDTVAKELKTLIVVDVLIGLIGIASMGEGEIEKLEILYGNPAGFFECKKLPLSFSRDSGSLCEESALHEVSDLRAG